MARKYRRKFKKRYCDVYTTTVTANAATIAYEKFRDSSGSAFANAQDIRITRIQLRMISYETASAWREAMIYLQRRQANSNPAVGDWFTENMARDCKLLHMYSVRYDANGIPSNKRAYLIDKKVNFRIPNDMDGFLVFDPDTANNLGVDIKWRIWYTITPV